MKINTETESNQSQGLNQSGASSGTSDEGNVIPNLFTEIATFARGIITPDHTPSLIEMMRTPLPSPLLTPPLLVL